MSTVAEGSVAWFVAFVVLAVLIVARQTWRGWRQGPVRQVLSVAALVSAYFVGWFGGRLAGPLLHPLFDLPHFAVTIGAGLALALLWYIAINVLSSILFKKTANQESAIVRMSYGISGAVLGALTGLITVWVLVMGLRLLGSVAESREDAVREQIRHSATAAGNPPGDAPSSGLLAGTLIRLKQSMELGPAKSVVETVDLVPQSVHRTLGDIARVVANPERAQRFLAYPGAQELAEHPKIRALTGDPEISERLSSGDYFSLLRHERVVEATNDPELGELLKKFDLQKAIKYALEP